MSDKESLSLFEQLKSSHSKEKKELQAKITSLKHSINKNDKKRKKEISCLIESMENELKFRHKHELKNLENQFSSPIISNNAEQEKNSEEDLDVTTEINERKPTRAQKRRDKKAEEIKKRTNAALKDEENAQFSRGIIETNEINKVLLKRNLKLHEVSPDGDCLYNSLSLQINKGRKFTGSQLREIASKYIHNNREHFLPFLTDKNGDSINELDFDEYCYNVQKTSQEGGAWGGEAELRAISNSLNLRIEVILPDGRFILFGEEFTEQKPLIVTYHRFAYALGEHYNSTSPLLLNDLSVNS